MPLLRQATSALVGLKMMQRRKTIMNIDVELLDSDSGSVNMFDSQTVANNIKFKLDQSMLQIASKNRLNRQVNEISELISEQSEESKEESEKPESESKSSKSSEEHSSQVSIESLQSLQSLLNRR